MWLKLLGEILPHAAPVARQYLSARTTDPAAKQMSEAIRHDIAEVSSANQSLSQQIEEQREIIVELQTQVDQMLPALQNSSARLAEVQEQTAAMWFLLKITLIFAVTATIAAFTAVILLMRHA